MATLISSTSASAPARDSLLRNALRGNGLFSALTGAAFILAAQPIAQLMGVSPEAAIVFIMLGVGLLGYAALLWVGASRQALDPRLGWLATAADIVWVVGSILILALDLFSLSTEGRWLVLIIAAIVLDFVIVQAIGLRRLRA